MTRGLALLGAVIALGATAALPAMARTHASPATAIRRYEPFSGGHLAAGFKVIRTVSGSCSSPSSEDKRSDAYRCAFSNVIADPCFADAAAGLHYVLCPYPSPKKEVARINLTQPLPHNSFPARPTGHPWVVETADGAWCWRYIGPRYPVLQFTIKYLCSGGFILTDPTRGTTWTAIYAPGLKVVKRPPGSYERVNLTSVWS